MKDCGNLKIKRLKIIKRVVIVLIFIFLFYFITTLSLYGLPFKKIPLGITQKGEQLFKPLAAKTNIAQMLNVPVQIFNYKLHFKYNIIPYSRQGSCLGLGEYEAYVRLNVQENSPFAKYAAKAFNEKSCYGEYDAMPQHEDGMYYFCVFSPKEVSFNYPGDQPISFSSILFFNEGSNCSKDGVIEKHDLAMDWNDLDFYATISFTEWVFDLLFVFIGWMVVFGIVLTVLQFILNGLNTED